MTANPGNLTSPGFPGNYPNNLNCRWTFVAENETQKVLFKFTYLKLEKNYDIITMHQERHYSDPQILLTGTYLVITIHNNYIKESDVDVIAGFG